MRISPVVYAVLLLWLLPASPAAAGEKYAFLVGISDYDPKQLKPLPYARADILEFRDLLLESGFASERIVMLVDDTRALPRADTTGRYLPERAKIQRELELLLPLLEEDDELIVAMSGHGTQFAGEDVAWFCPLDASLQDRNSLISMTWVYEQLQTWDDKAKRGCKARSRLLMMDACRKDPESVILKGEADVELELPTLQFAKPPEGLVALFSCDEGQSAHEHEPLRHGVFFHHVLEGLRGKADGDANQQVTLDEIVAFTKAGTADYARRKLAAAQTPRQQGFFNGTWILRELKRTPTFAESIGLQFASIPAGEFIMGSNETAAELRVAGIVIPDGVDVSDEAPARTVGMSAFRMQTTEVTRGQFREFVRSTGYRTDAEKDGKGGWGFNEQGFKQSPDYNWQATGFSQTDNHPVVNVSWNDAVAFCDWLTKQSQQRGEKVRYLLPTEAQFEYALRAGARTRFATGDSLQSLRGTANVQDASFERKLPNADYEKYPSFRFDDGSAFTAVVGSYQKNAFGLYDMSGNVWEWCRDPYDPKYYSSAPDQDPPGPSSGSSRVLRGGSWVNGPRFVRCAGRDYGAPERRDDGLGFRVLLE
ncbi:MAG: SUMF1/EgtB/PvdO family nonheme iron enzyme [Planctomycetia bacterium]